MEVTTLRPEVWNLSSVGGGGGNWSCEPAPTLTQASWVRAWVLSAMAALSLLGNAATIASIRRRHWAAAPGSCRHQPSAVYALILHLSAADLLVTVFCIAGEAAWSYAVQWLAGNAACKLFKFAQVFSLYLSTFILVLIGIDRFVAVRYPMRALGAANRLGRLVAAAWGLSALLSLPQEYIKDTSQEARTAEGRQKAFASARRRPPHYTLNPRHKAGCTRTTPRRAARDGLSASGHQLLVIHAASGGARKSFGDNASNRPQWSPPPLPT
ncbi:gonadotropin-releasing hormone II receptor-like [Schistocerca cancellata]|uniref:gonadotropin-releasing hormone II receptor-like n=1 Tax=Schistocerca cancellata TaxID=274614 RepID=UPI002117DA94|nr:gonadotropin-releasing hormone II receptor-like [Schistocerca cancellata]